MRKGALASRIRIVPVPAPKAMLESDEVFSKTSPVSWPVANTWTVPACSFRRRVGRVRIGVGCETTCRLQVPFTARTSRSRLLARFLPTTKTRPSLWTARFKWSSDSPLVAFSIGDQLVSGAPSTWNENRNALAFWSDHRTPIRLPPKLVRLQMSSVVRLVVFVGRRYVVLHCASEARLWLIRTREPCVHAAQRVPVESLSMTSASVE